MIFWHLPVYISKYHFFKSGPKTGSVLKQVLTPSKKRSVPYSILTTFLISFWKKGFKNRPKNTKFNTFWVYLHLLVLVKYSILPFQNLLFYQKRPNFDLLRHLKNHVFRVKNTCFLMQFVHLKKEYGALAFKARQKDVLATARTYFVSFGPVLRGPGGPISVFGTKCSKNRPKNTKFSTFWYIYTSQHW